MRARPHIPALAPALAACALLSACGSASTTTVTAKGTPPSTTSSTKTATSGTTSTSQSPPAPASSTGAAPSQTHTAPEPAFAEGEASSSAARALALVRAHGYTPADPGQYSEGQTLTVLIGRSTDSPVAAAQGSAEQAFFFLDGRFIGTDAKEPSASVRLVSQAATEVRLAYPLYRPGDPPGAPSAGQAIVAFQLNDGHLQALEAIPPVASPSAPSRR
jgi:hypothetical protein